MNTPRTPGGFRSIFYTIRQANEVGFGNMWSRLRSRNACKTCALGMGGQLGGMRNELGRFPQFCKKSVQAIAGDLRSGLNKEFFDHHSIEELRQLDGKTLERLGRIPVPLRIRKGERYFRPVSWDDAIDEIAKVMRQIEPQRTFFYCSGRSSSEAGFLLQLLGRAYGTNNVHNCSYYCHQASGVGVNSTLGTTTATIDLSDLGDADLLFLVGANPPSNHPRFMAHLMELKRRKGKIIVVNPVREPGLVRFRVPSDWRSLLFGSTIADQYLQINAGSDFAFFQGIAKKIIEEQKHDLPFISKYTEGFADYRNYLESLSYADIERETGISSAELGQVATHYASSKCTIFAWAMGITHHLNGVANVQSIVDCALLRGMVGKKGAGLLPLRGHSNVQGLGTVGVTPQLKEQVLERLVAKGLLAPQQKGLDTMSSMHAASDRKIDLALLVGGNLYASNPDSHFAAEALSRVSTQVHLNTTLNLGHLHSMGEAGWILPVQARDEEEQSTTQESMFNYVRLSDGGPSRVVGARSEVQILTKIAAALFGGEQEFRSAIPWSELQSHRNLRRWMQEIFPELKGISEIDRTRKEFTISNRVMHQPDFPTKDRKAHFQWSWAPYQAPAKPNALRLITLRSEGQFNSIIYESEDSHRGISHRNVVLVHPSTLQQLGFASHDLVNVVSEIGQVRNVEAIAFDIKPGHAVMYYPEANRLVKNAVDPQSRTPAFKMTWVWLTSSNDRSNGVVNIP